MHRPSAPSCLHSAPSIRFKHGGSATHVARDEPGGTVHVPSSPVSVVHAAPISSVSQPSGTTHSRKPNWLAVHVPGRPPLEQASPSIIPAQGSTNMHHNPPKPSSVQIPSPPKVK